MSSVKASNSPNKSSNLASTPANFHFRWADELDFPADEILLRIRYEDNSKL